MMVKIPVVNCGYPHNISTRGQFILVQSRFLPWINVIRNTTRFTALARWLSGSSTACTSLCWRCILPRVLGLTTCPCSISGFVQVLLDATCALPVAVVFGHHSDAMSRLVSGRGGALLKTWRIVVATGKGGSDPVAHVEVFWAL